MVPSLVGMHEQTCRAIDLRVGVMVVLTGAITVMKIRFGKSA